MPFQPGTLYIGGSDNESVNRCHQIGSRSQNAKITNSDRRDNIVIGTSIVASPVQNKLENNEIESKWLRVASMLIVTMIMTIVILTMMMV